ncbi:hypothetical protein ACVOMS_17365 [Bradyrhizobium guangxiense]
MEGHRGTAGGVGDALCRPHAAEHIDLGLGQRAVLAQDFDRRSEAVGQRCQHPWIGKLRRGRIEHVGQPLVTFHRATLSCLGLQQLGLVGSHLGEDQRTEWHLSKLCALKSEQARRRHRLHHLDVGAVGELLGQKINAEGLEPGSLLRRDHELRRAR